MTAPTPTPDTPAPLSAGEREELGDWWDSDWPDTQAGAMGTLIATVECILARRLAERDALAARLAKVEALADEWIARARAYYDVEDEPLYVVLSAYAGQLRAALSGDPGPDDTGSERGSR